MTQRVVISGLADGMGRETALLLAAKGVSIGGFDVDGDGLKSLAAELDGHGVDTVMSNVGIPFPFESIYSSTRARDAILLNHMRIKDRPA